MSVAGGKGSLGRLVGCMWVVVWCISAGDAGPARYCGFFNVMICNYGSDTEYDLVLEI